MSNDDSGIDLGKGAENLQGLFNAPFAIAFMILKAFVFVIKGAIFILTALAAIGKKK